MVAEEEMMKEMGKGRTTGTEEREWMTRGTEEDEGMRMAGHAETRLNEMTEVVKMMEGMRKAKEETDPLIALAKKSDPIEREPTNHATIVREKMIAMIDLGMMIATTDLGMSTGMTDLEMTGAVTDPGSKIALTGRETTSKMTDHGVTTAMTNLGAMTTCAIAVYMERVDVATIRNPARIKEDALAVEEMLSLRTTADENHPPTIDVERREESRRSRS